jgi:hypothetical protein
MINFINQPASLKQVTDREEFREMIPGKKKWCEENTRWIWNIVYYITNPSKNLWAERKLTPDTNFHLLERRIKEGNIYVNGD